MEARGTYKFNPENRIMYKYYSGSIRIEDIIDSWNQAINNNIIPKETKGFILDYRKATFELDILDYEKIPEYYYQHLDVFGGSKIAILTINPQDIVIPLLVKEKDLGYTSRPFSTEEAAIKWILR